MDLWDQREVEGDEEDGEESGVAGRKQRGRSREPFRLAFSGGLEICMPSAEQVRTGGILHCMEVCALLICGSSICGKIKY